MGAKERMKDRISIPLKYIPKSKERMELLLVFIHGKTREQIHEKVKRIKALCRQMFAEYVK